MKWQDLTLREKIGQTVCLMGKPEEEIKKFGSIEALLEKYPVGSIFVGGEIINAGDHKPEHVAEVTRNYRAATKVPLLFNADMEAGCGHMVKGLTQYPGLLALGAVNDEKLAYDYGKGTALEALSIGVNWSFSPVADLNMNSLNGLTNYRAVGDRPEHTIPILKQVIKGMQDHGMAATAKHFPGDGVDDRNQHLVTTTNSLSMEEWHKNHGAVFKQLIDDGVCAIMPGHICLPAYQQFDMAEDRYLPATLSGELLTGLLKGDLGFKGVIVSDALIMGGFMKWPGTQVEKEIQCFAAGTDMMLWPTLGYFDRMEEAIEKGDVSMERLDDAVSRIWAMKEKLGLFKEDAVYEKELTADEKIFVRSVGDRVGENSLTLQRDWNGLLPLKDTAGKKALVIPFIQDEKQKELPDIFVKALKEHGLEADIKYGGWLTDMEPLIEKYNYVFYPLYHHHMKSTEPGGSAWVSMCFGRERSIAISFGCPYVLNRYFESCGTCIDAYSEADISQEMVVKALFGKAEFKGTRPVA